MRQPKWLPRIFLGLIECSLRLPDYQICPSTKCLLAVPANLVHGWRWDVSVGGLVQHLAQWQDWLFARKLPRHEPVRQHYVDGRAQVQAEMRGNVDESVA